MKGALARLKASRAYRSWQHYNNARGGLLAGGVAYFAFFSVFPALTLGFAIFGFVLRGQPHLFHQFVSSVSSDLPGVVKDSAHPNGIINASKPPTPDALTLTGAVSLVVLMLSGLGWLSALREGVRAMFGQPTFKANPVAGRVRDLGILALLGLSVLASAALSGLSTSATQNALGWLGMDSGSIAGRVGLPIVVFVVVLLVDLGIVMVVLRLLSGVPVRWAALRSGAIVGAVGIGVLKVAVSYGVVGVSKNPALASFAVVVGLLIVMNLFSRVILLSASWAATGLGAVPEAPAIVLPGAEPARVLAAAPGVAVEPRRSVAFGGVRAPSPPLAEHPAREMEPTFGDRAGDRTALAAGAVLGVVASVAASTGRRAVRAAVSALRH